MFQGSKNAIFLCFDDNYFKYAKACIRSIQKNYPEYPMLLVLYLGESISVISWLKCVRRLDVLDPKEYYLDMNFFPEGPVNNDIVYKRYILWSHFFDEYEKILHLDVDTLILAPLDRVFEKNGFFCVSNHSPYDYLRNFKEGFRYDKKLNIFLEEDGFKRYPDSITDMINAGVFLISKEYRKKRYMDEIIKLTSRYSKYIRYADQSVISLWMLINNISSSTDFGVNFQVSYFVNPLVKTDLNSVCILHFIYHKPFTKDFCRWDPLL